MTRAFGDLERLDGSDLDIAIASAASALRACQNADGHFRFDLEADVAIPAEYVLLGHILGEPDDAAARLTAAFLRRKQEPHGGWPMLTGGALNLSASVKAYMALKAAGDPMDAPHMARARAAILAGGGAVNVNIFTRIFLAYFGIVPWHAVPAMPVEIMLLPRWSPFHLSKISYWARTTLVPLLVVIAFRPRAQNPRGVAIDELFLVPPHEVRRWPKTDNQRGLWGSVFAGLDRVVRRIEPLLSRRLRKRAIEAAVAFVRPRINGTDGFGGIFPAIVNTILMFHVLGVAKDDPDLALARIALKKLFADHGEEGFCQPCLSPVWDSALAAHALMEADPRDPAAARALDWLLPRQILDVVGDWAYTRPGLRPGGWAFQYANHFYPDLDDTPVVALALDRARRVTGTCRFDEAIARAREWTLGMQSTDGGWGAYDVDNDAAFLNAIPFADHGALLDPPTPDVAARCLALLGRLGDRPETSAPARRALDYLLRTQREEGSWFGRWGINLIYGTWSALTAFAEIGLSASHPAVLRGIGFLERAQNADGGWGEDDRGYALDEPDFAAASSTPSQTAWALLGLMEAGRAGSLSVARGIAYLVRTQSTDGFWAEQAFTGTGFPRVFYLRYDSYPKVFPLWALARWRRLGCGAADAPEPQGAFA